MRDSHGARAGVGLDLVGEEDGDVVLLGDARQTREHLVEFLLPLAQLASATIVDAEAVQDATRDESVSDALADGYGLGRRDDVQGQDAGIARLTDGSIGHSLDARVGASHGLTCRR